MQSVQATAIPRSLDGRTHHARCWREHTDCAEALLRDAAADLESAVEWCEMLGCRHVEAMATLARIRAALGES